MKLDRYLEHHLDIHGLVTSLQALLQGAGPQFHPAAARQGMVTLAAKLESRNPGG